MNVHCILVRNENITSCGIDGAETYGAFDTRRKRKSCFTAITVKNCARGHKAV